jgi:hypothetical protein
MTIIGLTGYAQAGKSTVANYLVEQHGFTRLSFAAPLKKMLRTLNPVLGAGGFESYQQMDVRLSTLVEDGLTEQEIKDSDYGKEYRRLLQVLATECIRAEQEDFWVRAAAAQIKDFNGKYVFDDVRFHNEAQFILSLSPEGLWNINRPGVEAVNGHVSEQLAGELGETLFLTNDRTVEMLYTDIDAALSLARELEDVL